MDRYIVIVSVCVFLKHKMGYLRASWVLSMFGG